jgi:hypothetical protein
MTSVSTCSAARQLQRCAFLPPTALHIPAAVAAALRFDQVFLSFDPTCLSRLDLTKAGLGQRIRSDPGLGPSDPVLFVLTTYCLVDWSQVRTSMQRGRYEFIWSSGQVLTSITLKWCHLNYTVNGPTDGRTDRGKNDWIGRAEECASDAPRRQVRGQAGWLKPGMQASVDS